MTDLIRPFAALRPTQEHVAAVIAPPYDVLTSSEAKEQAHNKPHNFLHISKPEIDLEVNNPYAEAVYAKGLQNLQQLIKQKILQQDPGHYYYVYRLTDGAHTQTGLVAVVSLAAYEENRVRKHELTRPEKEEDRMWHIASTQAQTGPVLLAYRHNEEFTARLQAVTEKPPELAAVAADGIKHELWVVRDPQQIAYFTEQGNAFNYLYIADGHHRSAAAARVAAAEKENKSAQYFLSVLFPSEQLRILSYNRVVKDLNGLSAEKFLQRLAQDFTVQPAIAPVVPQKTGDFGLYLAKQWYYLTPQQAVDPKITDPILALDVAQLTQKIIEPILGILDQRRDPRIDFVGGGRGLNELARRVDSGEMAAAFSLYPTPIEQLFAVADNQQIMPPKSTWFEPKLADGLVTHLF